MRSKRNLQTRKTNRLQAWLRTHKAQIQMSETIAVMFIFFVLILFGIVFYYKYSQIAYKEKQEEILGARAMEITLKTLFLPELICSRGVAELEDNCFDLIKLRQVNKTFKDNFGDYYFHLFPYTNISVQEIYPGNQTWTLYEKEKPAWEAKERTYFVVTLKDEIKGEERLGEYGLGVLTVEVYS